MQQQQINAQTHNTSRRCRNDYKRKRLLKSELTLDWAKTNVELTERKEKILNMLKSRHLMTIDQIEYFHPDFGHQSQSQLLLRRDINKLHEVYFLDKAMKKPVMQWDGSIKKTMVLALGEIGSQYAGWPKHYKRIAYKDRGTVLPKTAHHTLRIHDMEIQTRELLQSLGVNVYLWAYECGNQIIKHSSNKLNPDVFCLMEDTTNKKYYSAFMEYDTGKMDIGRKTKFPELSHKFNRYKEIKEWNDWYERPISRDCENKFPHLFFVTEDRNRVPGVTDVLNEKGFENTVCRQQDYLSQLTDFIRKMRG